MKLRAARKEDISFIQSLESREEYIPFIRYDSVENHCAQIEDSNTTLGIYELNGKSIGFLLGIYTPETKVYELRRVALSSTETGLGKAALILALKDAFDHYGANRVWLDVYSYNTRAIELYKSLGFVFEGTLVQNDVIQGKFVDQHIFRMLRVEYLKKLDEFNTIWNNINSSRNRENS